MLVFYVTSIEFYRPPHGVVLQFCEPGERWVQIHRVIVYESEEPLAQFVRAIFLDEMTPTLATQGVRDTGKHEGIHGGVECVANMWYM